MSRSPPPPGPPTGLQLPTAAGMLRSGEDGVQSLLRRLGASSRIAVVGSSGNLLYRGFGAEIDTHDVTFRANAPPLSGFAADVGTQIDVRVGWDGGIADAGDAGLIGPRETTVCCKLCRAWMTRTWPDELHEYMEVDDGWVRTLHAGLLRGKGDEPSTGFVALAMAVALAHRAHARTPVGVYGFGACPPCAKYYMCDARGQGGFIPGEIAAEASGRNAHHPYMEEKRVREAWVQGGVIRLIEPSCDGFEQRYIFPPRPPPALPPPCSPPAYPPPLSPPPPQPPPPAVPPPKPPPPAVPSPASPVPSAPPSPYPAPPPSAPSPPQPPRASESPMAPVDQSLQDLQPPPMPAMRPVLAAMGFNGFQMVFVLLIAAAMCACFCARQRCARVGGPSFSLRSSSIIGRGPIRNRKNRASSCCAMSGANEDVVSSQVTEMFELNEAARAAAASATVSAVVPGNVDGVVLQS